MEGRGGAMIAMLVVLGLARSEAATTYNVNPPGSNGGWTYLTDSNTSYDDAFKNIKLFVGDGLTFTFDGNEHNVVEVPPASVAACNSTNQPYTETTTVILKTAGEHGFICTIPFHCSEYGMHLLVTVLDSSANPSGTPSPDTGAPSSGTASFLPSRLAMIVGALAAACAILAL